MKPIFDLVNEIKHNACISSLIYFIAFSFRHTRNYNSAATVGITLGSITKTLIMRLDLKLDTPTIIIVRSGCPLN